MPRFLLACLLACSFTVPYPSYDWPADDIGITSWHVLDALLYTPLCDIAWLDAGVTWRTIPAAPDLVVAPLEPTAPAVQHAMGMYRSTGAAPRPA